MKTWLGSLVLVFMPVVAIAEPNLIGTWQSDRAASAAFNDAHSKLEPKTADFHKQSMGRLTLTVGANDIAYLMPDFDATIEGKHHGIVGFSERHPYKVVATTANSVAIITTEPVSHSEVIVVYNFDCPDRMWIYVSTLGQHIREYFTRVR